MGGFSPGAGLQLYLTGGLLGACSRRCDTACCACCTCHCLHLPALPGMGALEPYRTGCDLPVWRHPPVVARRPQPGRRPGPAGSLRPAAPAPASHRHCLHLWGAAGEARLVGCGSRPPSTAFLFVLLVWRCRRHMPAARTLFQTCALSHSPRSALTPITYCTALYCTAAGQSGLCSRVQSDAA